MLILILIQPVVLEVEDRFRETFHFVKEPVILLQQVQLKVIMVVLVIPVVVMVKVVVVELSLQELLVVLQQEELVVQEVDYLQLLHLTVYLAEVIDIMLVVAVVEDTDPPVLVAAVVPVA